MIRDCCTQKLCFFFRNKEPIFPQRPTQIMIRDVKDTELTDYGYFIL